MDRQASLHCGNHSVLACPLVCGMSAPRDGWQYGAYHCRHAATMPQRQAEITGFGQRSIQYRLADASREKGTQKGQSMGEPLYSCHDSYLRLLQSECQSMPTSGGGGIAQTR